MKKYIVLIMLLCSPLMLGAVDNGGGGCDQTRTADQIDASAQGKLLAEAQAETGLPAITHFQEKKLLKMVLELRDQENLQTYTYLVAEMTGKLVYVGRSIGYGIPYATEYTNPQRPALASETHEAGNIALPQADPNGLFMPSNANGTWVMMVSSKGDIKPVYFEPNVVVSPFKLTAE